ncbi:MAG TPA: glutaredoxin domain-containing protein [bacterium]|mgnify:CR=1 FL=1|nr:glutaredoxin domain-containing protein [bacterium]
MKKNNFKKIMNYLIIILLFLSFSKISQAQELKIDDSTKILFFGSPTCPHCLAEKQFLKELKEEYPNLIIEEYEFSKNIDLINELYQEYQVPKNQQGLVPATFIEGDFFVGFNEAIGKSISSKISGIESEKNEKIIKIPFIGEFDIYQFSLPALAIVLGIVDGFNVCSLGALVIILGLVMVLGSRKRILFLGGAFLLVTGITYGLLIFMWHQFFSIISPYIKSMELLIGILSIIGGVYLIREYIKSRKQGATCNSGGIIAKLSPKVEKIFANKKNIAILAGVVILFAAAVTIIEFPCSAFLPVLFASILVEANLSMPSTISFMALFILFYLLDEIIIFLIAFFTMRIKIVSPRFINIFNLLAALIFLFLGSFYLYRIFI